MAVDGVWIVSTLGVLGQVLLVLLAVIGLLALFGVRGPLDTLRGWLWGYELWAAFLVAAVATGGSLFYSEVMHYVPCELCWYQRLLMYPLSIFLLLMAIWGADRAARYIIALPIVGACVVDLPHARSRTTSSPSRRRARSRRLVAVASIGSTRGTSGTSGYRRSHSPRSSFSSHSWSSQAPGPPMTRLLFPPMPSGKKSREQRQQAATPPPVRSTGPGGARKASGRTLAIVGGVILVVIIAVVLAIVLTNNSSGGTTDGTNDSTPVGLPSGTAATGNAATSLLQNATFVDKTLKGIPQNGLVLGNPNAPVTLTEYIDLQCPVCADFVTTQLPTLVQKYVRPGKLKIKMQPWNILDANDGGDDSLRGQKFTIGASDQNKAFNFADVLYWNQGPRAPAGSTTRWRRASRRASPG